MPSSLDVGALAAEICGQKISVSEPIEEFDAKESFKRTEALSRHTQLPSLFDYQMDLVSLANKTVGAKGSGLISLPTGGGKTRTGSYLVLKFIAENPIANVIWLAPTLELLDQAHDTLARMWQEYGSVGDVVISRKLTSLGRAANIWLATPHGLNAKMTDAVNFDWDIIIFDEAHQIAAPTFQGAVSKIRKSSPKASLIGLSATPGRTHTGEVDGLAAVFNGNLLVSSTLGKHPVEFLQRRGVLARLDFKFIQSENDIFINSKSRLKLVFSKVTEIANSGSKSLIFTSSLEESEALSIALNNCGVNSHHVEGAMPENERRAKIKDFATGKCQVLTNQKLLTTGYDCPAVNNVFLTAKVSSPILFEQMVGRGARGTRTGGSRRATIWQFEDHLAIHGLPQSYYRYKDYEWN